MEARDEMNCRRASRYGAELKFFFYISFSPFISVRGDPVIHDTFVHPNLDTCSHKYGQLI